MSDFSFFDNNEVPQPRERVQIEALTATPYPDGTRVHLDIRLTPFLERPNLEIYARKAEGPVVAELSVIETMQHHLEFTLHIRGVQDTRGDYTLAVELFYADRQNPQHTKEVPFRIARTE